MSKYIQTQNLRREKILITDVFQRSAAQLVLAAVAMTLQVQTGHSLPADLLRYEQHHQLYQFLQIQVQNNQDDLKQYCVLFQVLREDSKCQELQSDN